MEECAETYVHPLQNKHLGPMKNRGKSEQRQPDGPLTTYQYPLSPRKAHIGKHEVMEDILPKGFPPFPELEEPLTLREENQRLKTRVESLKRDVAGGDAIILNLDKREQKADKFSLQVWDLHQDAANNKPFLREDRNEDEFPGITDFLSALQHREDWVWQQPRHHGQRVEKEEEEEEVKEADSDVEMTGVEY